MVGYFLRRFEEESRPGLISATTQRARSQGRCVFIVVPQALMTSTAGDDEPKKQEMPWAKSILVGNGTGLVSLVIFSFFLGMIFLTICGVKVVGPPAVMTVAGALPFAGPWPCSTQEVQAPRDLSTTANPGGLLPARAATLTDAQLNKMPQTNIHFILGTEHKSDEYNIATDSEEYDSANPNAVPNSAGEQVVDGEKVRPGYMCPVSGYSAAQLVDNYVWQCCTGEMHIGKVRGIGTASNTRQT
jgi:hypothetical protein